MSEFHLHDVLGGADPVRYRASRRVTLVSVALNIVLTVAQVVVGILCNSQALVADGMHTLSDLITDVVVLYALKHSAKGADEEHPYGHARIETATTMILGGTLLADLAQASATTVNSLFDAEPFVIPAAVTLWVAVVTLVAKEWLYRYTLRTANRFDSNMLRANAWHHRSDAISSFIVIAGIGGALYGFGYMDAVAAIAVALMIAKIGVGLAWPALRELIDTGLAGDDLDAIRHTIRSVTGVKALHMLRTRRVGGKALVDVHILVDARLSVSEGHQISETVRAKLIKEIEPVADVMVHIDIEEDTEDPSGVGLPLREEVIARLERYFAGIPEARMIERTTLHYLNGKIDVELLLSLSAAPNHKAGKQLAEKFAAAAQQDSAIGTIEVCFH